MAVLSANALTLADWASRTDPEGKQAVIANLLSQNNEVLQDMMWQPGNLPTGNQTVQRTGLPTVAFRNLNQGVAISKSQTAKIIDTTAMLEAWATIDKDIADLNGNTDAFRLQEDMAFLEAMNQKMAATLFYGNQFINPNQFNGLAPRYASVTPATSNTAYNVIDMGGTGSTNTSMWIVTWGPNYCTGIFPKGSIAGLQHRDLGDVVPAYDANNNQYAAYRTHYKWDCGLAVRDWRYIVRLANIDVTQLAASSGPNLIQGLMRGVERLPTQPASAGPIQQIGMGGEPSPGMGQVMIYSNRTIRTWLKIQSSYRPNMFLTQDQWSGKPAMMFEGIPLRNCDQILNTEARVV